MIRNSGPRRGFNRRGSGKVFEEIGDMGLKGTEGLVKDVVRRWRMRSCSLFGFEEIHGFTSVGQGKCGKGLMGFGFG